MTRPDLPAELNAALDTKLHGLSRNDAAMRAGAISRAYRGGGNSSAINSDTDALAYALARMPATYAAVVASLNALSEVHSGFAPKSLLDVGAGPGTAAWAAAEMFSSLQSFTLLDSNAALRTLALDLFNGGSHLQDVSYRQGNALTLLADAAPADLVIASYVIGEMDEAEQATLADAMWQKTQGSLVVVEPGTPAGYARIIALRRRLIGQGAIVAAPCPHDAPCPLVAPDWCHFAQRLPRSRAHIALKEASLPYEDEKFSYVALTREAVARPFARVLAQPVVSKIGVTAKLCTRDGLRIENVLRRGKEAFARARRWRWGDAVEE